MTVNCKSDKQHEMHASPTVFISFLGKVEQTLDLILQKAMVITGLGLAAIIFIQVVLRYVFQSSFAGIEEVSILLAVWIYFLGMSYATKENAHIHGGIVDLIISDRKKILMIKIFTTLVCFVTASVFGYFAIKYSIFVIERNRLSLFLHWPKFFWIASMVFGFILMASYFLLNVYKYWRCLNLESSGNMSTPEHHLHTNKGE